MQAVNLLVSIAEMQRWAKSVDCGPVVLVLSDYLIRPCTETLTLTRLHPVLHLPEIDQFLSSPLHVPPGASRDTPLPWTVATPGT